MPVSVRTCSTPADLQRSLEIFNEVWPRRAVTSEDVAAWKASTIANDEFLGVTDDVEAGSAAASIHTSQPDWCWTVITVLPSLRMRGVGSALFDAVCSWASDHGVEALETTVESDDEDSLGFALRRGFSEHSREIGLELNFATAESPAVAPLQGVEIVLLADRPELAYGVYEVGSEALPDIPGSEDWTPPPFEQFAAAHLQGLAIFVAVAGDEVVGYAKLRERPNDRAADHGMTAVKRAWRGRGVARSLKLAEIVWARENGIERLTATNEDRNAAMQRVNESLGYQPAPGRVHLRAPATTR